MDPNQDAAQKQARELEELLRLSQQTQGGTQGAGSPHVPPVTHMAAVRPDVPQQQPSRAISTNRGEVAWGTPSTQSQGQLFSVPNTQISDSQKQQQELAQLLRLTQMSNQSGSNVGGHAAVASAPFVNVAAVPADPARSLSGAHIGGGATGHTAMGVDSHIKRENGIQSQPSIKREGGSLGTDLNPMQPPAAPTTANPPNLGGTAFAHSTQPALSGTTQKSRQHVPWNTLSQEHREKLFAIRKQLQQRIALEYPNNVKGELEYMMKNHQACVKMNKTWVAQLIAEMYETRVAQIRQDHRERQQRALQEQARKSSETFGSASAAGVTPLAGFPSGGSTMGVRPGASRSMCGWQGKCNLMKSSTSQYCTGHTCNKVGCSNGKVASSTLCRGCETEVRRNQHQVTTAAAPTRDSIPSWAAKHRHEWDALDGHRRKVTDMMIHLYESITKNTVASDEDLQAMTEAVEHRVTANIDAESKQNHALKVTSFRPTPRPDPLLSQIPITTLLVAREALVSRRLAERQRQLEETLNFKLRRRISRPVEADDEDEVLAEIELRGLRLRKMQRALRLNIVSCEQSNRGRLATKSLRNDNAKLANNVAKLQDKVRHREETRRRKEETRWLTELIEHRKKFIEFHHKVQSTLQRTAHAVVTQFDRLARDAQRKELKEERERLAKLRMNDEEGYRALIDKEKHGRLAHLLDTTDEYMSKMMSQISSHQEIELAQEKQKLVFSPSVGGPPSRINSAPSATFTEDDLERIAEGDVDASLNRSTSGQFPMRSKFGEAHKIVEPVTEQASILVNGKLKEYQLRGLEWMVSLYNNKLNGILADEMGLGKTIQSISLVTYLMEKKQNMGPYLIVLPLSTMTNWVLEFDKWAPSVSYIPYKGKNRQTLYAKRIKALEFNVLITTFEFVIADKALLGKIDWVYLIIDEGHRLKNKDSKLTKALAKYYNAPRRLLLSGTPLQNNLSELWALLNFLLPQIFKSADSFDEWFAKPFAASGEKVELTQEERMLIVQRLHKVLRPFLLRRLKSEVENQLPEKVEHVLKCGMSALQARLYHHMKEHAVILSPPDLDDGTDNVKDQRGNVSYMNNQIMQLRKICNHPFLFRSVDEGFARHRGYRSGVLNADIWRSCGKFELLDRILPKLFKAGHRCLIFSQMVELLTVIEDFCNFKGFKYLKLDGSTRSEDRGSLIKKFNDPSSPYMLFILSTRAGGLGLNLQSADTVIIYDSDWNPSADLQAQDRAHRIGQKNEVRVFRLLTVNSIEEQILETARFKLQIDDQVIQAGKYNQSSSDSDRKEYLQKLLTADEEVEVHSDETSVPTNSELNRMLARRSGEFELFERMDKETIPGPRLLTDEDLPAWCIRSDGAVAWQAGEKDRVDMNLGRGNRGVERKSYKIPSEADVYAHDPQSERKRKTTSDPETASAPVALKRPRPDGSPTAMQVDEISTRTIAGTKLKITFGNLGKKPRVE